MRYNVRMNLHMKQNAMNKKKNAYFTVEAAMVMPIVVLIQITIFYLLFFQYNRCLMEQDIAALSIRASVLAKEDDWTLLERMKKEAEKVSQNKYIAWECSSPTIELERNVICIGQKCQQIFPFLNVEWQRENIWQSTIAYKVDRISPMEVVRSGKKIKVGGE